MFSISLIILAFFAGILGALIGGTHTFICTGFVGIVIFSEAISCFFFLAFL